MSFEGTAADGLIAKLSGVALSSGSACSSGSSEPSHVLRALGRSDALARSTLRFGLGRGNTVDEVNRVAERLIAEVRAARAEPGRAEPGRAGRE